MTGDAWLKNNSARTSGGSRIIPDPVGFLSGGPRTYRGGHGGDRGPRYYNGARTTSQDVTAPWSTSGARYDFYDASRWCPNEGFFRFGGTCRKCSSRVCPDGQYQVACTPGSDSYCTKCDNVCSQFNEQPDSTATSLPRRGTCLQASDAASGACNPNKDPFNCAYTSEGTPSKGVSDCQIESCCAECVNDEEAVLRGKGTVCRGSTKGLDAPDTITYLVFEGEFPMGERFFKEKMVQYTRCACACHGVYARARMHVSFLVQQMHIPCIA